MNRAAKTLFLGLIVGSLLTSVASAAVLAQYDAAGAATNPNTQGWSWNNTGNVGLGGALLLLNGAADPPQLFTETVSTNVFNAPWSMTGSFRFAGNGQEEYGRMMFVDDGTNIWHISFLNTGNDAVDGIYHGGDPNGPVLSNTATKIFVEPVDPNFAVGTPQNKPFENALDWGIVDTDGAGGAAPQIYLAGAPVGVFLPPSPSRFAAGTIGFGSLNPNESGFFQVGRVVFEGVPEPGALALAGIALVSVRRLSRHARGR